MSYRQRELKPTCSTGGCMNPVVNMRHYDHRILKAMGTVMNRKMCSTCNFWMKQFNHPYAVVSWCNNELWHYRLSSKDSPMKGFYGALWRITDTVTGVSVEWDNVWSQGAIPAHLHEKFLNVRPLVTMTQLRRGRR